MSVFTFNGQSCAEYGLTIEEFPNFISAKKETEKFPIAGKSGDFLYQSGRYENVEQEYQVYLTPPTGKSWIQAAKDIANWLGNVDGYAVLSDDYDPDSFRLAVFSGPLDMTNWFQRKGRATLTFDCQAQRYLNSGNTPISVAANGSFTNPGMPAWPLFAITCPDVTQHLISYITFSNDPTAENMTLRVDWSSDGGTVTVDTYSGDVTYSMNQQNPIIFYGEMSNPIPAGESTLLINTFVYDPSDDENKGAPVSGSDPTVSFVPRWWTL